LLPEVDEAEDLVVLLVLAWISTQGKPVNKSA
jgi:hypothetical protein